MISASDGRMYKGTMFFTSSASCFRRRFIPIHATAEARMLFIKGGGKRAREPRFFFITELYVLTPSPAKRQGSKIRSVKSRGEMTV
jgi:hypothetical protein